MKIVSFSEGQGGDEWLQWRKNGIGASDISVIMGSNPYKTPYQLWENKCGFRDEEPVNAAMQHGIRNEDRARQWCNEHFGLHLKPVCIEDNDKSHFKASLDGFDFETKTLVEIKCPFNPAVLERARLKQAVPNYWFDQVQWQIMLSGPTRAFIALWDDVHQCCITLDMFGDTTRIQSMRERADTFWHGVQIGKPPEIEAKDFIEIEDPRLQELLLEYQSITEKEKNFKDRKKELKTEIEEFAENRSITAYGFKIKRFPPPVKYDMDQMRMDGIDLDIYIKKTESLGWYRICAPNSSKK